ncbi:SusE domain-containing protein [Hwangdonia lutea]|uniref:SusE domain-containing protein n=1 Tax=Hwangdonia lutea TaxID=3075823 RepID=A0AA97EKM7_9FLAO|nr:SusE domain-containing protein [Hwangdonia sp. SCSIO 19198]WOD42862.1 SusE domain-containing protein [Hwangdonia sp. SCSIO 19198]
MNLYIKKISFLLFSLAFLFTACETEESLTITTPEAEFVLNTPGISTVFLNFALPDNPAFTISWNDEVTGGGTYNVEMSTDEAFTAPVTLGTTDSSNFSMTVAEFNNAIASTGVTTFKDVAIYMRVSAGSQMSNNILLLVTTYPVNAPEINNVNNGDAFVLSLDNNDVTAITVEWDDPILDSSLNQDVSYVLEGATAGTEFAMPIEAGNVTNQNSIALTNAQLNALAIQSGIAVDVSGDLDIRVKATITDSASGSVLERISSTVTISVTTYLTVLDLSTNWGVVGAVTGWGGSPDLPFWTTDVDGVLVAYVNLPTGEIKFRENMDWANNYGDNGADGTLDDGGANINITTAGSYKITMDLNNLTYTIEEFSLGIVGGAYNEWGATPDFMLEYDQYSDVFRGIVTLIDGEMKFRMNNDWGTNWGDDGVDGTLDAGGANIVVSAGIYIATVNMNDLTYTLEPIDYIWGLVGGAYNEWGATPDAQFTRDWSRPFNDIWILNDVTLIDGEYKFRANNDWGVNYGDDGGDGVLEAGGANLVTTAGTYSFVLDFSDPANPTYTKN